MYSGNYYRMQEDDLIDTDNLPDFLGDYVEKNEAGKVVCYKKPEGPGDPEQFEVKAEICAFVMYIDGEDETVVLLYDDGLESYESELVTI